MVDPVNHPPHYQFPGGRQAIEVTEHLSFCLGNVVKYVLRYERKGGVQDLEKAQWYLSREIARLSASEPPSAPRTAPEPQPEPTEHAGESGPPTMRLGLESVVLESLDGGELWRIVSPDGLAALRADPGEVPPPGTGDR